MDVVLNRIATSIIQLVLWGTAIWGLWYSRNFWE